MQYKWMDIKWCIWGNCVNWEIFAQCKYVLLDNPVNPESKILSLPNKKRLESLQSICSVVWIIGRTSFFLSLVYLLLVPLDSPLLFSFFFKRFINVDERSPADAKKKEQEKRLVKYSSFFLTSFCRVHMSWLLMNSVTNFYFVRALHLLTFDMEKRE